MKHFLRLLLAAGTIASGTADVLGASLTLPLVIHQDQTTYNRQPSVTNFTNFPWPPGTPLSVTTSNSSVGGSTLGPTPNQFRALIPFAGIPAKPDWRSASNSVLLKGTTAFSADVAAAMQLPGVKYDDGTSIILRRALVGGPFLSRKVSFQFGSEITPPASDENGNALPNGLSNASWIAQPYAANNDNGVSQGYYWSPNAEKAFAIQSGPISVTWQRANPTANLNYVNINGPPGGPNFVTNGGSFYPLFTARYIVASSSVQPTRKMYWTAGDFVKSGIPISVPTARVGDVHFVYNNSFPKRAATAFPQATVIEPDPAKRLDELRTIWYDKTIGTINAYNVEGRIFMEVLGNVRAGGGGDTRDFLGFEIVDVIREPNPDPLTTELGEHIPAYGDGTSDVDLVPQAIQDIGQTFAYQHNIEGSDRIEYFATAETRNLNDLQIHWLEQGLAGLRWPFRFVRYTLVWPVDVAKYSHYVRPLVRTEAEAKATAVPLPNENAPVIQYQDPLDQIRGKLTENFAYYTFLSREQPAHRGMLRFTSGSQVRFERVLSWLDEALLSGDIAQNDVVKNLDAWNGGTKPFDQLNNQVVARTYNAKVNVGDRILAPPGEVGSDPATDYLAGYIVVQDNRNSFHPGAYHDPFVDGFEAANKGAIIPVNAVPGKDQLDVFWFRQNQLGNEVLNAGFKPTYWPAVIARYQFQWPASPSEIVLASNDGSGALPSLQAKGSIYYQNDPALSGYNPNEEHALMQGGQAYALRDDLNLTASSDPFVLLDYVEADGRPAMRVFKVRREKIAATKSDSVLFDYQVKAGTILQPPMPLPLLEVPFAPKIPGQPRVSLNREFLSWTVTASTLAGQSWTLTTDIRHFLKAYEVAALQNPAASPLAAPVWFFPTNGGVSTLKGVTSSRRPYVLGGGAAVPSPNRWRFALAASTGLAANKAVLAASPDAAQAWAATVTEVNTTLNYVELDFGTATPNTAKNSTLLVLTDGTGAAGQFNNWRLALEPLPIHIADPTLREFYSSFTLQDRKGNRWVYRGPHEENGTAALTMQFYYKTLPGFYFPSLRSAEQPPVGTITPYLRSPDSQNPGTYIGDPVFGNFNNDQLGDGNPLGIRYRPVWPANTPVLEMAETLTLPKRGLPAARGQTSLQVLYQQSQVGLGDSGHTVILHDPTREKQLDFGADPASTTLLGAIPGSVETSASRGLTYFPTLPPHLVERFFFDPNRGAHGALVFKGEFVDAPLGDKYVFLNVLSGTDEAALKDLCPIIDTAHRQVWGQAIEGLQTKLEKFVENPAKPATFIPDPAATRTIGGTSLAEVTHSDQAVDSYALTAVGPGTGYVSLIAGNGLAFTPEGDPVSVQVIRVVPSLYRGEVNVVESSNPLNEKLTMEQVVDLAGRAQDFTFEWKIAAPVDGLPPVVYKNQPVTLLGDSVWSHVPFPLASDSVAGIQSIPEARVGKDVVTSVTAVSDIRFSRVQTDGSLFSFTVTPPHRLAPGIAVVMRNADGAEVFGTVHGLTTANTVVVQPDPNQPLTLAADDIAHLAERPHPGAPQSIVFRTFTVPASKTYSQVWLSLNLDAALGAKVYIDGQFLVQANLGDSDTPTGSAPGGLKPLERAYSLTPSALAGGTTNPDGAKQHIVAVELFSQAIPAASQNFNLHLEAFEAVDVTLGQWLPMDPDRFADGIRAILGGTADVRSLSDNYVIMRYQAKNPAHASWQDDGTGKNLGWSQWTTPQLAEGWIKRVLKGINPFNQRVTDLNNNQVNTDVSLVQQAGPRWEGDVALNLDALNHTGLIEIYETVLNRGKMLSIGGGIDYGPANDALLLVAGYLNDLYMILGNAAWADAANPTIGIGTKDNTYGEIATALFAFKGQLPSLLEEELGLLRGRDDFLLPGVETPPVYNRLVWNYTRGIDAGEVIYALNYNILNQNADGKVDAADAQKLYPQGHGDAYGHYLTALTGYYALLLDPNFDWVPRIEAVTVLGKPVSVDYQDERKFAAAAAAVARAGKQVFDLTWRRDFKAGSGNGWQHFAATKSNSTTRNISTTRYWGVDHWAARTAQGSYVNWVVGNALLPDTDPDHAGSIQQVDRTTVPELKELPAIGQSLQTAMDNAEGNLTPLGIPANTIPFDLNPLSIVNGNNTTHFEQVFQRAKGALQNAVVAFDDAKDITRLMRSEQDSLADVRTQLAQQELAYNNSLIGLYGTPYPEDIGPGKTYSTGYTGPDLIHPMYVDDKELKFGSLLDATQDITWKIDIQTFTPDWLKGDGTSDFSFIVKARTLPVDGVLDLTAAYEADPSHHYVEYNLSGHGFSKPSTWDGQRASPGRMQQSISDIIKARNSAFSAFYQGDAAKYDLDWAINALEQKVASHTYIRDRQVAIDALDTGFGALKLAADIVDKTLEMTKFYLDDSKGVLNEAIPRSLIVGLASGGDVTSAARSAILGAETASVALIDIRRVASFASIQAIQYADEVQKRFIELAIADEEWRQELRNATGEVRDKVYGMNNQFMAINAALQELDDAQRALRDLAAEGERIQEEREVTRQRAAAVIQGFRTRDAAFRVFRNEKLEHYKTLFDLAAQYTYMTAQAFDYETGLLATDEGKAFVNRIVQSRALGVITDGEPQFAGSNTGDPGLSSVMAEMNSDWSVLKTRLGFKNPDAYGTTASLRTENFRVLPSSDGDSKWTDTLNAARKANVLDDSDVRRYCLQIDRKNGLPVPGIVLEFSTTIADGLNLFGRSLAPGDHSFSAASFATKIFSVGVALEGYKGMEDPNANGTSIDSAHASSPADPNLAFLDPDALAANPYVYLIPVGLDSMRSPALGDTSDIRTWSVADVAIPLPFNIGGSKFSTAPLYQASDSLTEPLFAIRKHQPFRPVASANIFESLVVYWSGSELERSQYENTRLIGRSVWNSKWKLVIPGRTLLNDPNEGLDRLIRTVKDVKFYFLTYSYSGN